ncbi:hypothetical protein C2857_005607 [Epichloe festucae Fl1]|uniref:Secreted protein n=1 Tax=Epichloe festucae (strain Fl1) TaxID=877507 RepID=A0A7S9PVY9_EPIFF|nr:hypothetical protein C2857_005607 [Epichloe festucae Fl1]
MARTTIVDLRHSLPCLFSWLAACANTRAAELVDSLPQYKAIIAHARNALHGILSIGNPSCLAARNRSSCPSARTSRHFVFPGLDPRLYGKDAYLRQRASPTVAMMPSDSIASGKRRRRLRKRVSTAREQ